MSDPSAAMQKAVYARLTGYAPLVALVSTRVYDRAPETVVYPFVQIGYFQTVDDSSECIDGVEVFIELQAWSRAVGQVECKNVAAQIRAALHNWHPTLDDPFAAVGNIEHENTRPIGDGDGLTTRSVVTLKVLVEST